MRDLLINQHKAYGQFNFLPSLCPVSMERTIAKWMSKKQGDTFIDMITMLDITYTIAVVDKKSYEYWDQCYELKNMFDIDGESYVTRDVYNEKPRGL